MTETNSVITAVPVAFDTDGALNIEGSRQILEFVAESGNEGAFVLGTTGEFPALEYDERVALTQLSLEVLAPKMRVIVHCGAPSARQVLQLMDAARDAGATEVAVVAPYYLESSDDAIFDFFSQISEGGTGLDIYIYAFRQRTGNHINESLMSRLSKLPNIKGTKVSGENLDQIAAYRAAVDDSFVIYTGSDGDLANATAAGAQGVVSGVSAVFPKPFREMVAALESGDPDAIEAAQERIDLALRAVDGNLANMKEIAKRQGVAAGVTRMAVAGPDGEAIALIDQAVSTLG